jgi:uncharacterized protein YegL
MEETTKVRATDVTILLDRSGSMESIKTQTIEGVNAMIQDQKLDEGDCWVTLIQFDTEAPNKTVFDGLPIDEVRPLTNASFRPRGGTPLYDAIGLALAQTSRRTRGNADLLRLFVIVTDGFENASRKVTAEEVGRLIADKEEIGWRFIFLGANQDAILEARKIGIDSGRALTYGTEDREVLAAHQINSRLVRDIKLGKRESFTDEERREAKQ